MYTHVRRRLAALGLPFVCGALVLGCGGTDEPRHKGATAGAGGESATAGESSSVGGLGASGVGGADGSPGGTGVTAGGPGGVGVGGTGVGGVGPSGAGMGAAGVGGAGMSVGGTGAGGAGAGGVSGGETGSAGAAAGGPFVLAWQDDFDSLDAARWQLQTFSFDGNLAQFSTENASVQNGILSIALTPEPSDSAKPYRGVELRSLSTMTYGKVDARMRFAKGSGVVSSLVLIYTPWPADNWNEIDIEHLGKQNDSVQLNCMVYTGPPTTPPVTTSVTPTQDPLIAPLGFDGEADFHVYSIEWTPSRVRFSVDGTELRSWSSEIARMTLPQNILFTIWASNAASWAGPLTTDSAPTSADVDWIKVYDLVK